MSLKVWNGSSWVAVKAVPAWNGSAWVEPKSYKVWNGSAWVIAWVPPTTTSVSGPAWVMSTSAGSGAGSPNDIKPATLVVALSKPTSVKRVSLQLSYQGGAWTEYAAWDNPTQTSLSHVQAFTSNGAWKYRSVVTQHDNEVVTSAEVAITCYIKHLDAIVDNASPTEGTVVTITARCSGGDCGLGYQSAGWWHRWPGGGWNWSGGGNPLTWQSHNDGGAYIDWMWQEVFSDGSTINGAPVRVTVADAPPSNVTLNGGTHVELEAKMREAAAHPSKTLVLSGTFHLFGDAEIQAGITVIATGAKFNCSRNLGAYSRPGDAYQSGKFINENGSGLGGYEHAGWFVWDGGEFDGNGNSIFTISHAPGFTIKNATLYRYCADQDFFSWGDGHAIEVNSSGGDDNASGQNGTFNVIIQNCSFLGTDMGQRVWGNDEPMHYDWSWDGSGGRPPYDDTMTHNLRVTGCTFHRYSETPTVSGPGLGGYNSWGWKFAICAIGAHNPGSALRPANRHNHLQFDNNVIHGADGYAGSQLSFDKGAIHSHAARQVWVVNNQFYGCGGGNGGWQVTAQDSTDVTYNATPSGNASNNGGHPNEWRVANG